MGYVLRMGLMTYDTLAGRLGVGKHRHISTERARRILPCLRPEGLIDAFIYYDAQTDDTRLTDTVIRTAADHGARIANYSEVIAFDQDDGRIKRVVVRDCETGDEYVIRAGTVVNAGGVFAGRIEEMAGTDSKVTIKPAKGIHLTVPREKLKMNKAALVLPETEDGRLLFLVPWGPRVTIGTTDTKGGNIDHPVADEEDIEYLLRHVNHYMNCDLTRADVISAWAGYRPLVSTKHEESATSKLSRSHVVVDGPGGMVTVTGGKLTTYRRMAQDTLDHIAKRQGKAPSHVTEHLPLAGSVGWQVAIEELKADAPKYGLGPDTVTRLSTYGSTVRQIMDLLEEDSTLSARIVKDLPYIMAEVVFACRYEMAVHLTDVLERRLHINFEDWDRGYEVAPAVAEVMARELGWDTDRTGHEIENYRQDVRSEQPIPQDGPVDSSEDLSGYVRETTPRT
jgi:glycerol-3-phosphate dehydrogenase